MSVKGLIIGGVVVGFLIYFCFLFFMAFGSTLYDEGGLVEELDDMAQKDMTGQFKTNWDEHYSEDENQFGFKAKSQVIDEPEQKVKIIFIETGKTCPSIELIQPVSEDSSVYNFLKKTGGGLHHLSYEVGEKATKSKLVARCLNCFLLLHHYF